MMGMSTTGKRVLLAAPRGYCAGVERAVEAVERALAKHGAPVYVRKQIVHNLHVVHDLEAMGAVFVEEIDEVPEGAVAVLSAHGSPPTVFDEARGRGLELIDATCPLVTKVHVEARRFAARRPDDRADRPRGPRGGRGHERPGARPHRAGADRGGGARGRSADRPSRSPTSRRPRCRWTRRARSSGRCRSGIPDSRGPAPGGHLLRDPEPPGRGEGARAAGRRDARDRLEELVELQPAGRGRPGAGRARLPRRRRDARSTRRGWRAPRSSASRAGASAPEHLIEQMLAWLAAPGFERRRSRSPSPRRACGSACPRACARCRCARSTNDLLVVLGSLLLAAERDQLVLALLGADRDQSVAGLQREGTSRPVDPPRAALHRQHEHPGLGLEPELPQATARRPASPAARSSRRSSPRSPPAPSARPGAAARPARRTRSCRGRRRRSTPRPTRAGSARGARRRRGPPAPRAAPSTPARPPACRSAPRARRPPRPASGC